MKSLADYRIPVSVLAQMCGKTTQKILSEYKQLIEEERPEHYASSENGVYSLPLKEMPLDLQERYIREYILHDTLVDLDPFALVQWDSSMAERKFPIATSFQFQEFASRIALVRKAIKIENTYAGIHSTSSMLKKLAEDYGITHRTLNRWRKQYMSKLMINRLLDHNHAEFQYSDHRTSICLYAVDYAVYRHVYGINVSDNKILREFERMGDFSCNHCPYSPNYKGDADSIPFTCQRGRETMLKPANRYVLNRVSAEINKQDVLMCREGVRAWESAYHYTPARKRPEKFGFLYITDHHLADLFVKTKIYKDGTFDAKRVYITGVIDGATNVPVGYALRTDPPNASTVAEAFANAVGFTVDSPFHQLCRVYYSDNGKDYRSSLIQGNDSWSRKEWITPEESTEKYNPNLEFIDSGILNWFGIRSVKALPYRGCSKKIERHWRTLEEEFLSDLPGYCGNDPKHRPAKFLRDLKNGNIYTFEQFASYFADTIWPGWCNFKSEPHGKSPMDLYNEVEHEPTMTPSWRTLAVLKYKSEERVVHRDGIRFDNHAYWHPALASYIGERVHVFAFDSPFNRSIAVTSNHQYLCEAHPVHHLDTIEDQTWRVMQHLQEQNRQKLEVSKRLRRIEEIILKSDILQLGLDIPVVQHVTYAPAIDEEKDKTESEDDKRIPEELKKMAEKYAANSSGENAEAEPDPMENFFLAIGKELLKKGSEADEEN